MNKQKTKFENILYLTIAFIAMFFAVYFSVTIKSNFLSISRLTKNENLCYAANSDEYLNKTFEIEYYDYTENNKYEKIESEDLTRFVVFGSNTELAMLEKDDVEFVGWFGYDEIKNKFYNNQYDEANDIYVEEFNSQTAFSSIDESIIDRIVIYETPLIFDETEVFGKIVLYSKLQKDINIVVESQNYNYDFVQSLDGGTISIDDNVINQPNISSKFVLGDKIDFVISPKANYNFLGMYLNDVNIKNLENVDYNFDIESNSINVSIENINATINDIKIKFTYNTYLINLQKKLINELKTDELTAVDKVSFISVESIVDGIEMVNNSYYIDGYILVKKGETLKIEINPDINYSLTQNPLKIEKIKSDSDLVATYELIDSKYILSFQNNWGCGIFDVTMNMQKYYNQLQLVYGTNAETNNFIGSKANFVDSIKNEQGEIIYSTFNIRTNSQTSIDGERIVSKAADVYHGQDAVIMLNILKGYKFDSAATVIEYAGGGDISFEYINKNGSIEGIRIFNINDDINISLKFIKRIEVVISATTVEDDGKNVVVGNVKLGSGNWKEYIEEYVDDGLDLNIETAQIDLSEKAVFDAWIIKDANNNEIIYQDYGIRIEDLKNNSITIKNIDKDLYVTANYTKKNFYVKLIWNGLNGNIISTSNHTKTENGYQVKYGDDISLKITPYNEKYFIKNLYLETVGEFERNNFDGYTIVTIKNIDKEHRINVSIEPDTWWLHLTKYELDGVGTKENPYVIKTAEEFCLIGYLINNNIKEKEGCISYNKGYYSLRSDIDLGDKYFYVPIGNMQNKFAGVFDFNYYAIENINTEFQLEEYSYGGLFYNIDETGKVIRQFRSKIPFIVGISGIGFVVIVAFAIVFRIEKRRQKPKKVFVLKSELKNEKNNKFFDN